MVAAEPVTRLTVVLTGSTWSTVFLGSEPENRAFEIRQPVSTIGHAGGKPAQGNHELVEQRGTASVRQFARHMGEKLSAGGILRNALAVAAGMQNEDELTGEGIRILIISCRI